MQTETRSFEVSVTRRFRNEVQWCCFKSEYLSPLGEEQAVVERICMRSLALFSFVLVVNVVMYLRFSLTVESGLGLERLIRSRLLLEWNELDC